MPRPRCCRTRRGAAIGPAIAQAVTDCPDNSTSSWASANDGAWENSDNWTNGVPGGSCIAVITLPGTYVVTVSTGVGANGVTLGGASGTQTPQIAGTTKLDGTPQGAILGINDNLTVGTRCVLQLTASSRNAGGATTTGGSARIARQPASTSVTPQEIPSTPKTSAARRHRAVGETAPESPSRPAPRWP